MQTSANYHEEPTTVPRQLMPSGRLLRSLHNLVDSPNVGSREISPARYVTSGALSAISTLCSHPHPSVPPLSHFYYPLPPHVSPFRLSPATRNWRLLSLPWEKVPRIISVLRAGRRCDLQTEKTDPDNHQHHSQHHHHHHHCHLQQRRKQQQ